MNPKLLQARRLVARALDISIDSVGDGASIETLDAWDSIGHMRVVLEVECVMGVELEAEQILALENIEDVASLLDHSSNFVGDQRVG